MIDVHLIGFTADLEHLVLDLDGDAAGRYRLVVDADLLATLHEIRERRLAAGQAWAGDELFVDEDEWVEEALEDDEWDEQALEDEESLDDEDGEDAEDAEDAAGLVVLTGLDDPELGLFDDDDFDDDEFDLLVGREPEPAAEPEPAPEPEPAAEAAPEPTAEAGPDATPEAPPEAGEPTGDEDAQVALPRKEAATAGVDAKLSPAQIQALLRAGRSPKTVAKRAGTDEAWIERWLPPILEERARMLREARSKKLERARLGRSRDALGDAVRKQLRDRGVPEDDAAWDTSRRADGTWRVSVKYRHRGKNRTASWRYDPRDGGLSPSSDLARELGWTGKRGSRRSSSASAAASAKSSSSSAAKKPVETARPDWQPADDR